MLPVLNDPAHIHMHTYLFRDTSFFKQLVDITQATRVYKR